MNENNFYEEYGDNGSKQVYSNGISETKVKSNVAFIKVFLWMFAGVFVTFLTGIGCAELVKYSLATGNSGVFTFFIVLMAISYIAQFVMCFMIGKSAITDRKPVAATVEFLIFSVLNGISFSILFAIIDMPLLFQVFGFVCLYFLILAGVSFLFKSKLEKLGTFALVGLITLVITSLIGGVVSWFITDHAYYTLSLGISILGLVVFTILTIVDVKKIKLTLDQTDNQSGIAIYGAFELYLDFINIFLYVLRIIIMIAGNSRKD